MTLALLPKFGQVPELLRGDPACIRRWVTTWQSGRALGHIAVIFVGAGLFGASVGIWRSPLQAIYAGIKFPIIILLTVLGNAAINAMLAPLLGLNLRFRESFLAILASFAIAGSILGAFSPLAAFLVWNAPPLSQQAELSVGTYRVIQLTHVAVIAFPGLAANMKLLRLLRDLSGNRVVANRVLAAWLAGNLLLGTQLSWILRPFIGLPTLAVQFLRPDAFQGNFYETVFRSFSQLLQ